MKLKKIEPEAKKEMLQEKIEKSKTLLKERITEIKQAKRTLAKLEKQYKELLEKDVDEIEIDNDVTTVSGIKHYVDNCFISQTN